MAASRSRPPLGFTEVAEAVEGFGGAEVAAVAEVEDGQPVAVQEGHDHHRVLAAGAEAVDGDHPGVPGGGHEPRRERAELAGDVHVGVVEAEGGARVPEVHLGGEGDPGAGVESAVGDGEEPAHDGVRAVVGVREHGPDDGVHPGRDQAVRAGAQGGEGAGQRDPAVTGGVDAEPGAAGERRAGAGSQLSLIHIVGRPLPSL